MSRSTLLRLFSRAPRTLTNDEGAIVRLYDADEPTAGSALVDRAVSFQGRPAAAVPERHQATGAIRAVRSTAVREEWMEEHRVAGLHRHQHPVRFVEHAF